MAAGRHGSWYLRLDLPAGPDGWRRRIRRGGYPSRHVRLYLKPYLGRILLAELSAAHVQAMFTAVARHRQVW